MSMRSTIASRSTRATTASTSSSAASRSRSTNSRTRPGTSTRLSSARATSGHQLVRRRAHDPRRGGRRGGQGPDHRRVQHPAAGGRAGHTGDGGGGPPGAGRRPPRPPPAPARPRPSRRRRRRARRPPRAPRVSRPRGGSSGRHRGSARVSRGDRGQHHGRPPSAALRHAASRSVEAASIAPAARAFPHPLRMRRPTPMTGILAPDGHAPWATNTDSEGRTDLDVRPASGEGWCRAFRAPAGRRRGKHHRPAYFEQQGDRRMSRPSTVGTALRCAPRGSRRSAGSGPAGDEARARRNRRTRPCPGSGCWTSSPGTSSGPRSSCSAAPPARARPCSRPRGARARARPAPSPGSPWTTTTTTRRRSGATSSRRWPGPACRCPGPRAGPGGAAGRLAGAAAGRGPRRVRAARRPGARRRRPHHRPVDHRRARPAAAQRRRPVAAGAVRPRGPAAAAAPLPARRHAGGDPRRPAQLHRGRRPATCSPRWACR